MNLQTFTESATAYYDTIRNVNENQEYVAFRDDLYAKMDEYKRENPNLHPALYKARIHELIAEGFIPVLFKDCPFYFETGLRDARSLGGGYIDSPPMWGVDRSVRRARQLDCILRASYAPSKETEEDYLGLACGPVFDEDHHCPGYTRIFEKGLDGIIKDIDSLLEISDKSSDEYAFRLAAKRSLIALIRISERFGEAAKAQLEASDRSDDTRYLSMIIDAASVVPRKPPQTFYQGLCTLLFTYTVLEAIEGVGMSVIGHVDRLLGKLYENDLKHGIITEDEAVSFLEIWLSIQDIRCDSKVSSWADISCTLELGGCDQNGVTVFNRVTELVASVHERLNLINPKLNCRISEDSPEEYLHLISASLLRSHNVIALLNDDTIIPALISSGKELRDARLYVNGGCQETIVEGSEHSAGVMFYFNLPLVLDLSLNKTRRKNLPDAIEKALPTVIESAMDFEDFYNQYFTNMKRALSYAADIRRPFGEQWHKTHPSPAFSATLTGCIESGKDYTAGGAKYNNGTACCIGFATLSDSLLAIKRAVFEDKIITLSELRRALAADFTGYETLRARLVAYPKFGHGDDEADELAARVFDDLNRFTATLDNERGGKYVFSTFTFSHHMVAAPYVGATPDGRLKGEPLSQSTGPSRVRPVTELTDAIRAQSKLPLDKSAGISVLDVMLPSSSSLSVEKLATTLRAFCAYGGQTLQPNRVTRERMIEAKNNPDQHRDLIVRVCGLSVYFVNLSEENKNDMIARNMYVN